MKKTLKIVGNITRYFFGFTFIITSFTSLNKGHPIRFIMGLGFGILLLPVIYKTINEEKMYKSKWEILFPIIWFSIFGIIVNFFGLE